MKRMLLVVLVLSCTRTNSPEIAHPSASDGHGTAWVLPCDPVVAGSRGTWDFVFKAGKGGLPPGGGIVFQVTPFWGWSPPQISDPARPGFCSVSTAASCSLVPYADSGRMYLLAQVRGRALAEGEEVAFRYGDTGEGRHPGGAASVEPYAERYQEFLIKTDGDGDGVYGEIPVQPGLQVRARPASDLWVNAPSLVTPGQPFAVTVAALDEAGNCDEDYRGEIAITVNGHASAPAVLCLSEQDRGAGRFEATMPGPGVVMFAVVDEVCGLAARSNPVLCGSAGRFHRVFWGDIHGHTGLSDGTGTPGDYYRYARDVAGLDVASVTDHDSWGFRPLKGVSWDSVTAATARYHEPGRFVTILAYEWTSWTYGHRNVYFPHDSGEVFPYDDEATGTPQQLWRMLKPCNAMTIAHHSGGGPIGTDWSVRPPPDQEMLVEVFSVHGSSEFWGCPGSIYSPVEGRFVQDALARGYRLGFLASGDGHIGHPGRWSPGNTQGLVAFQADTLTREAVWRALITRRVYGTSGSRILLQFTVNDMPMGSELPSTAGKNPRRIDVVACGTAPVSSIDIVKNGEVWRSVAAEGVVATFSETDSSRVDVGDYYYARIVQLDGHMAWSSPVWIGQGQE
ncbi:CehA/McbA family metallohydrolase [Candidatus Fermentibacteria bacterium]|nr:CehA/McbA family metallohydrolase [Candidatus Fermentibacteria bacterium]